MLSGIVAMTRENRVMGKDNSLPWKIPGDLKFFKSVTLGQRIVMGRKTFESIGSRALPKRENWVLSRRDPGPVSGVSFFSSPNEIFDQLKRSGINKKTFIIGGADVFRVFWKEIDEIYVTWVESDISGDVYFPELDWGDFQCLSERRETDPIPHSFCHYVRKN